jgi:hypothetical protein
MLPVAAVGECCVSSSCLGDTCTLVRVLRHSHVGSGQWLLSIDRVAAGAVLMHAFTLQAKEEDKSQLLGMCNDLMTRLEREGLSA